MDQQAPTGPGAGQDPSSAQLRWVHPTSLISLSFTNYVLSLVTLGIYSFWGKTEVRKRIWSAIRLEGEPLLYTGTGKELFLGFLFVFFIVLLPIMLLTFGAAVYFGPQSVAYTLFTLGLYLLVFFLVGVAIYRATRYRLSRTRWRGIRGALVGSDVHYAFTYFWTLPLMILTLGWLAPWRTTKLQRILINDMRFGDRPFVFTATSKPLYPRFAIIWVAGMIIALVASSIIGYQIYTDVQGNLDNPSEAKINLKSGIIIYATFFLGFLLYGIASAWYYAFQFNHFARNTHFEGSTFRANLKGTGLVWLTVTNTLIAILSLGILSPVIQARTMRYIIQRMGFVGTPDFSAIAQAAEQDIQTGEGLAQAFDIDAF